MDLVDHTALPVASCGSPELRTVFIGINIKFALPLRNRVWLKPTLTTNNRGYVNILRLYGAEWPEHFLICDMIQSQSVILIMFQGFC